MRMRNFYSYLRAMLVLLLMVSGVGTAWGQTWTRVTNIADLTSGGTFIIGYEETANSGIIVPMQNSGSGISTSDSGYMYSGTTSGSSTSGTIDMSNPGTTTNYEIEIQESISSGQILVKVGNYYLGQNSGENKLRYFTSESIKTRYTPKYENNVWELKCAQTYTVSKKTTTYYIQYNSIKDQQRFSGYSGTQKNVVIFKKVTPVATKYSITANEAANGTYTVNGTDISGYKFIADAAAAGETVTLEASPISGYKATADCWQVYEGGTNAVTVTSSSTTYTFTMPAGNVSISPAFVEDNTTAVLSATATANNGQASITVAQGADVTLTCTAQNGAAPYNYEWYSNTTASNEGGTAISGAEAATYSVLTTTPGTYYYYCYVVDADCENDATSNVVTVEVAEPTTKDTYSKVTDTTLTSGEYLIVGAKNATSFGLLSYGTVDASGRLDYGGIYTSVLSDLPATIENPKSKYVWHLTVAEENQVTIYNPANEKYLGTSPTSPTYRIEFKDALADAKTYTYASGSSDYGTFSLSYENGTQTRYYLGVSDGNDKNGYYYWRNYQATNLPGGEGGVVLTFYKKVVGEPTTYTVTYYANDGTGTMTDETYDEGVTVTVKDNDFTREGYDFTGWNTQADGSGAAYANGDTFTINGNTVFYAQWSDNQSSGGG